MPITIYSHAHQEFQEWVTAWVRLGFIGSLTKKAMMNLNTHQSEDFDRCLREVHEQKIPYEQLASIGSFCRIVNSDTRQPLIHILRTGSMVKVRIDLPTRPPFWYFDLSTKTIEDWTAELSRLPASTRKFTQASLMKTVVTLLQNPRFYTDKSGKYHRDSYASMKAASEDVRQLPHADLYHVMQSPLMTEEVWHSSLSLVKTYADDKHQ